MSICRNWFWLIGRLLELELVPVVPVVELVLVVPVVLAGVVMLIVVVLVLDVRSGEHVHQCTAREWGSGEFRRAVVADGVDRVFVFGGGRPGARGGVL